MSVSSINGFVIEGTDLARFKFMFDYGPRIGSKPWEDINEPEIIDKAIQKILASGEALTEEESTFIKDFRQGASDAWVQGCPKKNASAAYLQGWELTCIQAEQRDFAEEERLINKYAP